ncbi:hypothetical protein SVAN01_10427 [Stagonosporopsis vannaccii]|nr:hypothetical protein SVAN01_10427 [Stagonosporopsis vannaccii]
MLYHLPPELLIYITDDISETTTLLALAQTHRCFRSIVRERLLRNASIPLRSIPHFIALISRHPMWAHSITIIELRDDTPEHKSILYSTPAMTACKKLLSSKPQGHARAAWEFALQIYHASPVLWTAMLFLALPCARALRIKPQSNEMPIAYKFVLQRYMRTCSQSEFLSRLYARSHSHPDLLSRLETYVLKRVCVLDVHAPHELYDPISVSHLPNLHTLAVDGACLRPHTLQGIGTHQVAVLDATRQPGSLPARLKMLLVRGDVETMPWAWLKELQWYQSRDRIERAAFVDLGVRLYFSMSFRAVEERVFRQPRPEAFGDIDVGMLLATWFIIGADVQTLFQAEDDGAAGGKIEFYEQNLLFGSKAEAMGREAMRKELL